MKPFYLNPQQTFLILGMGKSGTATASWLKEQGFRVITYDDIKLDSNLYLLDHLPWHEITAVIQSPGIACQFPKPHPIIALAKRNSIPILTDINLLQLSNPYARFVGVTGTNGKSTTTALIGHILQKNDYECVTGGNIGVPALSLPKLSSKGIYVLELSSFQLEISEPLNFDVAAWLNITPDHLERHNTLENYIKVKEKIFLNAHHAVINLDDSYSQEVRQRLQNREIPYVSVSCCHTADVQVRAGILYHNRQEILDLSCLEMLKGKHNHQNVATAYAVCKTLNVNDDKIVKGLETFQGLEHRQEIIANHQNILFVNDSKGTNAEATAFALKAYQDYPLYWIIGGQPKTGGIHRLKEYFSYVHHVFIIGEAQRDFEATVKGHISYILCDDLTHAFHEAIDLVQQDQLKNSFDRPCVILLSPACASLDQFESFEHRGDVFRGLVKDFLRMSL